MSGTRRSVVFAVCVAAILAVSAPMPIHATPSCPSPPDAQGFVAAPGSPFAVGGMNPVKIAVGDFNGDGIRDLATANVNSSNISALLGDGAGGFASAPGSPYSLDGLGWGSHPRDLAAADFNGDGRDDLIGLQDEPRLVNQAGIADNVALLLADGDGGFSAEVQGRYTVGPEPRSIAVGDFDNDGHPDLAVTNTTFGEETFVNKVEILLGRGSGQNGVWFDVGAIVVDRELPYGSGPLNRWWAGPPQSIEVGDFNGDGNPDLVMTTPRGTQDVSVWLGDGTGRFAAAAGSPFTALLATQLVSVAIGEFNGDGLADLTLTHGTFGVSNQFRPISVLLGDGNGSFSPTPDSPLAVSAGSISAVDVAVGDFNADGFADITFIGGLSVLLGDGNGNFTLASGSPFYVANANSLVVADFNRDGREDVAVANVQTSDITVFLATADSSPPAITSVLAGPLGTNGWYVGDVTIDWNVQDNESSVSSTSGCGAVSVTSDTHGVTFSCTATSAGGTASESVIVKLDKTPPAVTCGTADTLWHNANVAIGCTAADSVSGLASPSPATFTLMTSVPANTEDANTATNSLTVYDNAGNFTTAGPISGNKVDREAPGITINSPAATAYRLNQAVASDYSCADGGSGVASCHAPAADGVNLDTALVGTKTFTVNASDAVGNTTSRSVEYQVGYAVCLLYDSSRAARAGSTLPLRIQLCDASGVNVSAQDRIVTALQVLKLSDSSASDVVDLGDANPDNNFRYDTGLGGSGGYIFNMPTRGLTTGTYVLVFGVTGDPTLHNSEVLFQIR